MQDSKGFVVVVVVMVEKKFKFKLSNLVSTWKSRAQPLVHHDWLLIGSVKVRHVGQRSFFQAAATFKNQDVPVKLAALRVSTNILKDWARIGS